MGFKIENHTLLRYKAENQETHVIIPDGVEVISIQAFLWAKYMEVLTIPPSVRIIENSAFKFCRDLKEIRITAGVAEIGEYAFQDSWKLRRLIYRDRAVLINHVHIHTVLKMIDHKNFRASVPDFIKYDLLQAMFLDDSQDGKIIRYMQKDFRKFSLYLIENDQYEMLDKILKSGEFVNQKNIDELIRIAVENQAHEIYLLLMEYKQQKNWYQEITDKFKL